MGTAEMYWGARDGDSDGAGAGSAAPLADGAGAGAASAGAAAGAEEIDAGIGAAGEAVGGLSHPWVLVPSWRADCGEVEEERAAQWLPLDFLHVRLVECADRAAGVATAAAAAVFEKSRDVIIF